MSDSAPRVPEMALVVGVLFSASFLAFELVVDAGRLVRSPTFAVRVVAAATALLYPCAAYAAVRGDVTRLVPPRFALAAATAVGLGTFLLGLFGDVSVATAVALLVVLPVLGYALAADAALRRPAREALAVACLIASLALAVGAVTDPLAPGLAAFVVLLGYTAYEDRLAADGVDARTVLVLGAVGTCGVLALAAVRPAALPLAAVPAGWAVAHYRLRVPGRY